MNKRVLATSMVLAAMLSTSAMAATFTYHQYIPLFFGGTVTDTSGGTTTPTPIDEIITLADNGGYLPNATIDTPYTFDLKTLTSTSGPKATSVSSLGWSLGTGTLPSGLTLYSNGYISGQPLSTNGGTFQVIATSTNTSAQKVYTIMVNGVSALQATSISSSHYHSCALTAAGGVKCWGRNTYAQLGTGDSLNRGIPTDVVGLSSGIRKIVVGGQHTCAITTTNGLKCWGDDGYGQLGPVPSNAPSAIKYPQDVTGFTSGIVDVALGFDHTCALRDTGQVQCWGNRAGVGQLGDNMTSGYTINPVSVATLTAGSGVVALSKGSASDHTCAIFNTGGVKCWGGNFYSQLGANGSTNTNIPQQVSGLTSGVARVVADMDATCALTTGGEVKCWGYRGHLGVNAAADSRTPVTVPGLTSGVVDVAIGYLGTCAVKSDGSSVCWGNAAPTDSGFGTNATQVAIGRTTTCMILASGNTKCKGSDAYGELGNDPTTTATTTTPVYVYGN